MKAVRTVTKLLKQTIYRTLEIKGLQESDEGLVKKND